MKSILITLIITFATLCHAGLLYQYNQLTLMGLDQMNKLVQDKLKEEKKAVAKTVPLKEGIQAVYARPDSDRMIEKVVSPLRSELQDMGEYERVMTQLVNEALEVLKNNKNFRPPVQVTYDFFIENWMADNRRLAEEEDGFERKMLQKIKKANIKISDKAQNERRVRGFPDAKSPSEIADEILVGIDKLDQQKAQEEKAAKAASAEKPSSSNESK